MIDKKPKLFLPSRLVAEGVVCPAGWVLHPSLDGWMPPITTADATVPASDTAVTTEQAARQSTTPKA